MATSSKVCRYLDMPIQHFSNEILRKMNRQITGEKILERISKLKKEIPGIFLRTSIIVGFPGETDEDFEKLLEGVEKSRFHHLGIFRYSDEEGTPAYKLPNKVSQDVIEERFDRLYEIQREISRQLNEELLGETLEVLIEGTHEETELLVRGRHQGQAPDIDGNVIINDLGDHESLNVGDLVKVKITQVLDHDLVGRII